MVQKATESTDRLAEAFTKAIETVIGAVAAGAATAAQAAQATAGAQAATGGTSAQTGLAAQAAAADISYKADVSVPEVIESLNVHAVKDAVLVNKTLVAQAQSNAKLYDITATSLGLAALGASHNMALQQQMASDHRDQNHDKQINVDEQALAVVQATIIQASAAAATAAVLAALGKTGSNV
jgi:hypothetical protein